MSFVGQAFFYFWGRSKQREGLRMALNGEVASLCDLLINHGYINQAIKAIEALKSEKPPLSPPIFSIHGSFIRMYDRNIENIGMLRSQTIPLIVRVYDSAEVLVELSKHFQPNSVLGGPRLDKSLRNWLSTASQLLKAAKEFLSKDSPAAEHVAQIDEAIKQMDRVLQ